MKLRLSLRLALLWGALAAAVSLHGQGTTSSAIAGRVTDSGGNALAGAQVTITYEPTATATVLSTFANGRFSTSGLRPGGPYSVVVQADGYQPAGQKDLTLGLNQTQDLNFRLTSSTEEVIDLGRYVVPAAESPIFSTAMAGPRTSLDVEQVSQVPTTDRTLNDLVRLNPLIVSDRDPAFPRFTAAGANNRYNSIKIDGVEAGDPFGLQDNGQPARAQLYPLDWIDTFNVEIAPYDTRYAGFTGAAVNAVTKSGSNQFHGSAYTYYRDDSLVGDKLDGKDVAPRSFEEWTYGATVSGPILPNRLFFFLGYEKVDDKRQAPKPVVGLDSAQLAEIKRVATAYGIAEEIGEWEAPDQLSQPDEKMIAKLDWQINPDHRLSVRYNSTEGEEPRFQNYDSPVRTSFSTHWNVNNRQFQAYVAQLFSNWTPEFSTEATISRSEYDSTWTLFTDLPEITIQGLKNTADLNGKNPLTEVKLGAEIFRHANVLNTQTDAAEFIGKYLLDNHTLTAGVQYDTNDVYNLFFPYSLGSYTFKSISDWEKAATTAGLASRYQNDYALPGQDPAGAYTADNWAVFVNDSWKINPNLTVGFGLRWDIPVVDDRPAYFSTFEKVYGVRNDLTIDGSDVLQPRVSFNYITNEDKTILRGGLGLFYGKVPAVWLSNSFSNTGVAIGSDRTTTDKLYVNDPQPPPAGTAPVSRINYLDPDFQIPTSWKLNLAIDQKLPWLDMIGTLEVLHVEVDKAIHYTNDNLNVLGTMPDGREIYGGGTGTAGRYKNKEFFDVIKLTNTDKGSSDNVVAAIERPRQEDGWYWKAAYVFGRAKDVNPGTSSQATSSWARKGYLNPNEDIAATSNFEIRDRLLFIVSKDFRFFERFKTNLTLVYDGQSGRPFSWTFGNDINNDGDTNKNDLFYVPTGPSDPLFGGMKDPKYQAEFFDFIDNTPALAAYRGQTVPRNSDRDPFIHTFDLKVSQEIGIWENHKVELFFSILNVGNLLDDDWGKVYRSDFPLARSMAKGTADTKTGKYVYEYNPVLATIQDRVSRWEILVGAKYSF